MGQTVREPVAVVGPIVVHQSPSEKLTEGTVQQRCLLPPVRVSTRGNLVR